MHQIIKRYIKILKIKINDVYPDAIGYINVLEERELTRPYLNGK